MSQVLFNFDGETLITPEMIAAESAAHLRDDAQDDVFATARIQLALALNISQQRLEKGEAPTTVVGFLFGALHDMRRQLDPAVWQDLVPIAQAHPISVLIHQDPFTQRSFEKPRGYSGDAGLLDFIYRHPDAEAAVAASSDLGRAIYEYTSAAPAASAVRERRDLLAAHVDAIAETRGEDSEILTIAAGHLREAERSSAFREGRIKRWVALDQDPMSVGLISRDFAGTCVDAMDGSVKGLLTNSYDLGRFDFVYAAGLYDYLPENAAVRLTRKCLDMLKPNGVFLFANFHDDIVDDGYMETLMNWTLILRSEDDMWNIIRASVDMNTVDTRVEFGANRNIIYGLITRRD
ncbi:methyltransferase [Aureimonas sp. SA4125]|uniref:class I SAM-dependent methyltransferase n=1 Tax=Aureimonas sp. SA4125 TaxID=2826993 RepID=UPI001CC673F5|nr:class I SAM-dependent methyltransferase [Aureimonas sp. SA4125]BDA83454.1 methyltransferase [Aureimonas sp. SA4125]